MGNAGLVGLASHLGISEPVELFVGEGTLIHLLDIVSGSFQDRDGGDLIEVRRGEERVRRAEFGGEDDMESISVWKNGELV